MAERKFVHIAVQVVFAHVVVDADISWDNVRSCADDGVTSGKYRFEVGDVIFSKI